MMRLAFACAHWERIGGSERYAMWLAEELANAGHELLVLHERGVPTRLRGARFLQLGTAVALRAALASFRPERALVLGAVPSEHWLELTRAAPVIRWVQDHTLFCPARNKLLAGAEPCTRPMGAACLERALDSGCHGIEGRRRLGRMLARLAETSAELELARRAARLVVSSRWMRAELLRLGLEPERVALLPYPAMGPEAPDARPRGEPAAAARAQHTVHPEPNRERETGRIAAPLQPSLPPPGPPGWVGVVVDGGASDGQGPEVPLVLCAARLAHPDKGVDYLLTALGLVRAPCRTVIAGDGPARGWLEEKALAEGLAERVRFAGWLDGPSLSELYRRARVVAFPSIWDEPFGLVGLEAMSHARAVVAFDVGGVREWLVPGETGLLAPRKDVAELARAIESLVEDGELAARLGQAGRERARTEFAPERHLERVLGIVAEAR